MIKYEVTAFNPAANIDKSYGEFDSLSEARLRVNVAGLPTGTLIEIQRYVYGTETPFFNSQIKSAEFVDSFDIA